MGDLLSAVSILLVFLGYLFNSIDKEVGSALAEIRPDAAQTNKRADFKRKQQRVLFSKAVPITIAFAVVSYCLLPQIIEVIQSSRIAFWKFDTLKTLLVLIEFCFIGLTGFSFWRTLALGRFILQT